MRNLLELTVIPVYQPKTLFKKRGETFKGEDFTIRPDYIRINWDIIDGDTYFRIKNSPYWRCKGLRGYTFAITVNLSI